jgi:hypothetical protein
VLEFPQSQERFVGKANFIAWRKIYPSSLEFKIRRIRGRGDLWVAENSIRYDGGPWNYACSILEFRSDKIARETIYSNPTGAIKWEGDFSRGLRPQTPAFGLRII